MGNSELDLHHRKRGDAPDDTGRNVDHRPDPGAFGHDDAGFILGRTAEVDEDHDWAAVSQTAGAVHHPEPMTARQDWTRPSGTETPEDHPASETWASGSTPFEPGFPESAPRVHGRAPGTARPPDFGGSGDHRGPRSQAEGRSGVRPNPAVLASLTRKAGSRVLLTAVNVGLRTVRSIRRRLPV